MIVECPACKSRYDLSGRPPGTKGRCRCGTIFELPVRTQAAMLQCPKCGGNVAATNHSCEFCEAALLVKACPRCFARVFHGSNNCGDCGADVVRPAAADPDGNATKRACPRCISTTLIARVVGETLLDECPTCHGVFLDMDALDRILREREQSRASALLGLSPSQGAATETALQTGPMYVKCPDCAHMMNRRNFARGAGIIIDVCSAHGTWFDAQELPRVVKFVMDGGLEVAKKRELERLQEDAKRARQRASMAGVGTSGLGGSLPGMRVVRTVDTVDVFGGVLSVVGSFLLGNR